MKYTPGAMVGQLSGSLGSTTASHNRNGSYFRGRVIPVNPSSAKQSTQRNNFTELSQNWRGLTDAQRAAWAALGAQMARLNSLGVTYTLTGNQAFLSVNRNRRLFGLADLSDAPAMPSVQLLTTLAASVQDSDADTTVSWTPTPIGATTYILIEASAPVSAGRNFMPRSGYKLMLASAANAASPQDISAAYLAAYGTLAGKVGAKVFVRAALMTADGFVGTPLKTTAIVEAA